MPALSTRSVACNKCGGKFFLSTLRIHLKMCGQQILPTNLRAADPRAQVRHHLSCIHRRYMNTLVTTLLTQVEGTSGRQSPVLQAAADSTAACAQGVDALSPLSVITPPFVYLVLVPTLQMSQMSRLFFSDFSSPTRSY